MDSVHYEFHMPSVRSLWSVMSAVNKAKAKACKHNYYPNGPSHEWLAWYDQVWFEGLAKEGHCRRLVVLLLWVVTLLAYLLGLVVLSGYLSMQYREGEQYRVPDLRAGVWFVMFAPAFLW